MKLAPPPISPFESAGIVPLSLREAAQIGGGTIANSPSWSSIEVAPPPPHFPLRQSQPEKGDWSESIQAVLEQPPSRLTGYLVGLGLLFSGIFATWACIGQTQEVSHAQGKLIPKGKIYKIQPVVQGKIDSILVQEGELVQKGQVLLALDADLSEADVDRLVQSLAAAEKALAQARSLATKTQQESAAHGRIAAANTEAAKATLEQSQSAVEANQALLAALNSEMNVHQERLDRISALETQGAISKEYVFGIEQGIRERQQTITQDQGQLAQSVAQARKAKAELAQKQAEAQQIGIDAQLSLQKLDTETQQLEATIADLRTQLAQAKTKLSQSYVRASTEGIVSALDVGNIGEVVQPGQVIAEIAPKSTPLILSAFVPNREAGLLKVGMEAQVKMDAFPYQTYGVMAGEVRSISPDAHLNNGAETGYQVDVDLDKSFVMHEHQRVNLQMGQTASAEIVVRHRRIIEALLDPIRRISGNKLSL